MRANIIYFNPRAPCGARQKYNKEEKRLLKISTHAPLAGRDRSTYIDLFHEVEFQPTRPLRGATL